MIDRRSVIATALAVTGGLGTAGARTPTMGRIDTHHHFLPPELVAAVGEARLAASTPYGRMPGWSPEIALATCDAMGIDRAILSISPGYAVEDQSREPATLRACNEAATRLRSAHPTRFGHFASVPMSDRASALLEITYALDVLKADGIVVATNYSGRYLGDPDFAEIWQELDRRRALVFIHPTHPQYTLASMPPESVMEYPFETTRAATSLAFAGVTQRHRGIRFILSHAGGTLPYLAARIAGGAQLDPRLRERIPDPMAELRSFWFDTALSGNLSALSALMQFADPSRILFGTDFPYAPTPVIQANIHGLESVVTDPVQRRAITRGNAETLFSPAIS